MLGVLLLVFAGATTWLLAWPAGGTVPPRVDAVVMLAGPGDRLPVALRLARTDRAPVLVVSRGNQGYGGPCPPPDSVPGTKIICFDPVPADTRGESEYTARLARRDGWNSIALVTTPDQAVRALLLLRRCYAGSVAMVTAPLSAGQWPYQIAYGWGALVKALMEGGSC